MYKLLYVHFRLKIVQADEFILITPIDEDQAKTVDIPQMR